MTDSSMWFSCHRWAGYQGSHEIPTTYILFFSCLSSLLWTILMLHHQNSWSISIFVVTPLATMRNLPGDQWCNCFVSPPCFKNVCSYTLQLLSFHLTPKSYAAEHRTIFNHAHLSMQSTEMEVATLQSNVLIPIKQGSKLQCMSSVFHSPSHILKMTMREWRKILLQSFKLVLL